MTKRTRPRQWLRPWTGRKVPVDRWSDAAQSCIRVGL